MEYYSTYASPIGEIFLASDEKGLTQLRFNNHYHDLILHDNEYIVLAKEWLDEYFKGVEPQVIVPLHLKGTPFQKKVWNILLTIPYGHTTTYGAIAGIIEKISGKRMASQAVGGAVGRNPIAMIVPCHRVIGKNGSLVGYAYGLDKKEFMLNIEKGKTC